MISIIVPVYNAADYVSRTIENLIRQEVEKEIILVNDGSTDDSLSVLKNYEKEYDFIRLIDKKNQGVSSARNEGIKAASGKYLMFVDSDDLLEEDSLKEISIILSNEADMDTVVFSYQHVNEDLKNISTINYMSSGRYSLDVWIADFENLMNSHIVSCIGTKIYRTDIIKQHNILFNQRLSHYEDISFAFEYLQYVRNIYYVDKPYYLYVHLDRQNLFKRYCYNMIEAADYCYRMVSNIVSINKSKLYVNNLLEECISNEIQAKDRSISSKVNCLSTLKGSYIYNCYNQIYGRTLRTYLIDNNLLTLLVVLEMTTSKISGCYTNIVAYVKIIINRVYGKN